MSEAEAEDRESHEKLAKRLAQKLSCDTELVKELLRNLPAGYKHMLARPGCRTQVIEVMENGQWYTRDQILAAVQKTFKEASSSIVQNALTALRRRPPHGKELVPQRIGNKFQYRMRKAAFSVRQVPSKLVTDLLEGIAPIIAELKQEGGRHEYEMVPGAIKELAIRLERLVKPLKQSVSS